MSSLQLHPLCSLFPRLTGAEFAALRDDIKANGLREPIVVHDGMVLDGGNRYAACLAAGVEPALKQFDGGNLVTFVLSANLHRRHLSPGQQAAIVASAQDWASAQSRGRPSATDEKRCNVAPFSTAADRAAQSGASLRTQKMADKVAQADPGLAMQVAHGSVSLPDAVRKVSKPADENRVEQDPATRGSALPATEPPSIVAQRAPGPVTVTSGAELNPAATESSDESGQPDAAQLLDELNADLRAAQSRIETLERALQADDARAQTLIAIKRAEHAERRAEEVMQDSAAAKRRADFYERQLSRIGKAVGEKDLDRVAPKVEAMARAAKEAA